MQESIILKWQLQVTSEDVTRAVTLSCGEAEPGQAGSVGDFRGWVWPVHLPGVVSSGEG